MSHELVNEALACGQKAYPAVAVSARAFSAFVADLPLAGRHLADLYLACGLAAADPAALAAFEAETLPAVERGLSRMSLSTDARGELLQRLREQMLVGKAGRPGIAGYDGRAPLAIWLRVCAARLGQRDLVRERRAAPTDDHKLEQLAPGVPDPELAYLRRHYGDRFQTAFGEAVAALAPRERNLLRHAVLDRLGIDQIAAIYHVHRATAARQLRAAREALIAGTRERMRLALGASASELESIMRLLVSVADVTLRHVLARRGQHAQETE
jgi:RNA polymerase sigma-70 factor (ECF subfamily)